MEPGPDSVLETGMSSSGLSHERHQGVAAGLPQGLQSQQVEQQTVLGGTVQVFAMFQLHQLDP